MDLVSPEVEQLIVEHRTLMHHYGEAQARCSELVRAQAAEIERLQGQAMRLRACVILRDTALAWAREQGTLLVEAEDLAGLEASLGAADLVICQTGCLSHGAYWRVQDHCKRTGKACVLVAQPDAVRIVRIHKGAKDLAAEGKLA